MPRLNGKYAVVLGDTSPCAALRTARNPPPSITWRSPNEDHGGNPHHLFSDRNFVTLKIETDEGIHGLGDATLNGRELAVAAYLQEHVLPCLIGRDPFQTEDIWQYLYRGAYWRRGPVTMTAIAAVDVALWDIKGKALNTPVYNLLGGKSREGILVYTHANGADIPETLDSVRRHMDEGYLAVRAVRSTWRRFELWRPQGWKALRIGRARPPVRKPVVDRRIPELRAWPVRKASYRTGL